MTSPQKAFEIDAIRISVSGSGALPESSADFAEAGEGGLAVADSGDHQAGRAGAEKGDRAGEADGLLEEPVLGEGALRRGGGAACRQGGNEQAPEKRRFSSNEPRD